MKKGILSFGMMLFVSMSVFGQNLALNKASSGEVKAHGTSSIKWERSTIDLGTIEKGGPVTALFEFTNSGSAPTSIRKVITSCGCTVTDYSKNSLALGESGFVKVIFNAAKVGAFQKNVVVSTLLEGEQKILVLKGFVK